MELGFYAHFIALCVWLVSALTAICSLNFPEGNAIRETSQRNVSDAKDRHEI